MSPIRGVKSTGKPSAAAFVAQYFASPRYSGKSCRRSQAYAVHWHAS